MSYPTTPEPSSITLRSTQPTLVSVSHSLARQVRSRGCQRWSLTIDYRNLKRSEYAALYAFAVSQRGQYGSFYVVPVVLGLPQGTASGTPLAAGSGAAGSRSIATDGWSSGASLKAGDLIKFAGHHKVYMITADATANGSGQATIAIEPGLHAAVADNEAITARNVPIRMAFSGDVQELPIAGMTFASLTFDLIEVIE